MKGRARFSHTNLIAGNWKSLARFYEEVFGCKPVPPERHYRGSVLARGTGVSGAELHGVHLRLPGFGDAGPTLEIYSYEPQEARVPSVVNRPGFGHIAFEVDDIAQTRQAILDASGSTVGDVVTLDLTTGAKVTWCYMRDPEGNIIEIQRWS